MATAASDHCIKIFNNTTSGFMLSESWKAHDGPVVSLSFSHPHHALLASCSFDKTTRIWQELRGKFVEKARICDGRDMNVVEFSSEGLKLCVGGKGIVRIWECLDFVQVNSWTLMVTF
jgi:nucleoporin SEH1